MLLIQILDFYLPKCLRDEICDFLPLHLIFYLYTGESDWKGYYLCGINKDNIDNRGNNIYGFATKFELLQYNKFHVYEIVVDNNTQEPDNNISDVTVMLLKHFYTFEGAFDYCLQQYILRNDENPLKTIRGPGGYCHRLVESIFCRKICYSLEIQSPRYDKPVFVGIVENINNNISMYSLEPPALWI